MMNPSEGDEFGTVEISGFGNLNLFDFVKTEIPKNRWPVRIRIGGMAESGLVAGKIHYIDVDGTDPEAINEYLRTNGELPVIEIDCEIDILKLLSEANQLDMILPNTARIIENRALRVQR